MKPIVTGHCYHSKFERAVPAAMETAEAGEVLAWLGLVRLWMSTQQTSMRHDGGQWDVLQATICMATAAS